MNNSQGRLITLTVPGMGSDHCAGIVRKTLQRLDGVEHIETNIANHYVKVTTKSNGPNAYYRNRR